MKKSHALSGVILILVGISIFLLRHQGSENEFRKAVLESSSDLGIRLGEKAIHHLQIVTIPFNPAIIQNLRKTALVYFQDRVGVYRLRDGWYKLVETKDLTDSFKEGDHIIVQGSSLLRVAEMEAFGGEG